MRENGFLIDENAYLRIRFAVIDYFRFYRKCATRQCRRARHCLFMTEETRKTCCHHLFDEVTGRTIDSFADMATLCYFHAEMGDIASLAAFTDSTYAPKRVAVRLAHLAARPGTPEFRNLSVAFAATQQWVSSHSGTAYQNDTTEALDSNVSSSP